jgi:hypothetical protein
MPPNVSIGCFKILEEILYSECPEIFSILTHWWFYPHVFVPWVTGWSLRCTLSVFRYREGGGQRYPLFPGVHLPVVHMTQPWCFLHSWLSPVMALMQAKKRIMVF